MILYRNGMRFIMFYFLLVLPSMAWSEMKAISQIEVLMMSCYTCHGQNAKGSGKVPSLHDIDLTDIIETMNDFKTGHEKSTIMGPYAKAYSDQEIEALANFIKNPKD